MADLNVDNKNVSGSLMISKIDQILEIFPFVCGLCDKRFDKILPYVEHLKLHKSVDLEGLHVCSDSIDHDNEELIGNSDQQVMYTCSMCECTFWTICQLHLHVIKKEKLETYVYRHASRKAEQHHELHVIETTNSENQFIKEELIPESDTSCPGEDNLTVDKTCTQNTLKLSSRVVQRPEGRAEVNVTDCVNVDDSVSLSIDIRAAPKQGKKRRAKNNNKISTRKVQRNKAQKTIVTRNDRATKRDRTTKFNNDSKNSAHVSRILHTAPQVFGAYNYDDSMYIKRDASGNENANEYISTSEYTLRKKPKSLKTSELEVEDKKNAVKTESDYKLKDLSKTVQSDILVNINSKEEELGSDIEIKYKLEVNDLHVNTVDNQGKCLSGSDTDSYSTDMLEPKIDFPHTEQESSPTKDSNSEEMAKKRDSRKRRKDESGDITFPCHVCGKMVRRHYMKRHMMSHQETRNWICDICQKGFKSKHILQGHKLNHATERNFICKYCGKDFHTRANLRQHERTHTAQKEHQCPLCSERFTRPRILRRHLVTHSDIKPHVCEVCSHAFKLRDQLVQHMKRHSDLRPYVCPTCEKAFKTRRDCQKHQKIHEPFQHFCNFCKKGFVTASNLKIHLRTHSKDYRIENTV